MKKTFVIYLSVMASLFTAAPSATSAAQLLVEAERFDDLGGWVVDQQFMDQMGSPFLLAHGLGRPVADAVTSVTFPRADRYRVWVRTRDWVAPWNAPGAPGRFELSVAGRRLETTFGTEGEPWHWQNGGVVRIDEVTVSLVLHDLTGFEGRCDAIFFTTDLGDAPPNEDPAMRQWRQGLLGLSDGPLEAGRYDFVVVGGGIAGTCASLAAARGGATVALIQDRPVLGGNNSSEVRVWLGGKTGYEPYARIGDIVRELEPERRAHYGPANTAELYEDQRRIDLVRAEPNITLFLQYRANAVETTGPSITAVTAQHTITGQRLRFVGDHFADCTGDGCIGFLAGADYDMTLDGHMGRCNLWNVAETDQPVPFPRCPWAIDLSDKPFPSKEHQLGGWYWESGFYHDPFEKGEYIRDLNFRAMYGAWDALKNARGLYPNHKLNWAAYISGKRESRRLLGDIVLTKADIVGAVAYPDGCVPATWSIDLHLPDPAYDDGFEGDEFISKAYYTAYSKPYWVPYRCLYSRNIENLFMAGRDISVTHEALGAVRVMRTCGMMGEVIGMAGALCTRYKTAPRAIYTDHFDELKGMMAGPDMSAWLESAGANLALGAQVSVSSNHNMSMYPAANINDARTDTTDNNLRWLSSASTMPDHVTFVWPEPQTVSALRIISGWFNGQNTTDPIADFHLEYNLDRTWREVTGSRRTNNARVEIVQEFAPVHTKRLRLVISRTPGNIARIWEVEFYHPQ